MYFWAKFPISHFMALFPSARRSTHCSESKHQGGSGSKTILATRVSKLRTAAAPFENEKGGHSGTGQCERTRLRGWGDSADDCGSRVIVRQECGAARCQVERQHLGVRGEGINSAIQVDCRVDHKGRGTDESRQPRYGIDLIEIRIDYGCECGRIESIKRLVEVPVSGKEGLVARKRRRRTRRDTGVAYELRNCGGRVDGIDVVAEIGFVHRSIQYGHGVGLGAQSRGADNSDPSRCGIERV